MSDPFTAEHAGMLPTLLDTLVPASADGRLPSAGSLDLAGHIARTMERMPVLRPAVEYGLGVLADRAREQHAGGWSALSPAERTAVVAAFAADDQFFLPAFLFLVYAGYYTHPRVVAALGLEARPPHPQGYAMPPDDFGLLDPVRRRGKMYRQP
jgi:gluconate 2-dehydrogenase subunit 3-like protein